MVRQSSMRHKHWRTNQQDEGQTVQKKSMGDFTSSNIHPCRWAPRWWDWFHTWRGTSTGKHVFFLNQSIESKTQIGKQFFPHGRFSGSKWSRIPNHSTSPSVAQKVFGNSPQIEQSVRWTSYLAPKDSNTPLHLCALSNEGIWPARSRVSNGFQVWWDWILRTWKVKIYWVTLWLWLT